MYEERKMAPGKEGGKLDDSFHLDDDDDELSAMANGYFSNTSSTGKLRR